MCPPPWAASDTGGPGLPHPAVRRPQPAGLHHRLTVPDRRHRPTRRRDDRLLHSRQRRPWILPGVPPSGLRVSAPVITVVGFDATAVHSEHIYWDQTPVPARVGLFIPAT